jgi:hypothetical protein
MIDRAATIEKFGHDPDELKPKSGKRVVAVCDGCGKVRDITKQYYRDLCPPCAMKKCHGTPKAREKNSVAQKKRYEDHPESREKHSVATKRRFEDPKEREKMSIAQKKRYEDHPENRAKLSVAQKKRYEDPKERIKQSGATKKYYKDNPKAGAKNGASIKKYWEEHPKARENMSIVKKKHYKDHPETIEKLSTSQKKRWEDPKAHEKHSAARQHVPYEKWEAFAVDKPYCPAFNETCRESNREKYGRRCFICDLPEAENKTKTGKVRKLSVHHVDLNRAQGCDGHEWKLIPTCIHHHGMAHTPIWIGRIAYLLRVGA